MLLDLPRLSEEYKRYFVEDPIIKKAVEELKSVGLLNTVKYRGRYYGQKLSQYIEKQHETYKTDMFFISKCLKQIDDGTFDLSVKEHRIPKKDGTKRIIFDPNDSYKNLLKILNKYLKHFLFTKKATRLLLKERLEDPIKGRKLAITIKGKQRSKLVYPTDVGCQMILDRISRDIDSYRQGKWYYLGILRVDVKDAYLSTPYDKFIKESARLLVRAEYSKSSLYSLLMPECLKLMFINGKLPPGFPTSPTIFTFMIRKIMKKFSGVTNHTDAMGIHMVNSTVDTLYADDLSLMYLSCKDINTQAKNYLRNSVCKFLRKNGYGVNKRKLRFIPVLKQDRSGISAIMKSTKFLGKHLQEHSCLRWRGSRKELKRIRLLRHILDKETKHSKSEKDSNYESSSALNSKIFSTQRYYFPQPGETEYSV